MRAERAGPPQAPAGERGREGFERALREAGEGRRRGADAAPRKPTSTGTATSSATATAMPIATQPPIAPQDPAPGPGAGEAAPASRAAEVAARAVAAVSALREGGRVALLVAGADGIRYEVAGGARGVELRAVAPPLLERVARADLHAVAVGCVRRGLAVGRATVRVEAGGRGQRRKR